MKTDVQGCSTCPVGSEHYEHFRAIGGVQCVQYDYRHASGALFSVVARSLDRARTLRDEWLEKRGLS